MRTRKLLVSLFIPILLMSCNNNKSEINSIDYTTISVKSSAITLNEPFPATVKGRQDIEIYPQVSGTITKVCVTEGQRVKKGQELFIIDQIPYYAALQTATANVEAAKTNVETARIELESKQMLFNENVVSEYDLSNAKNAFNVASARLKQAEAEELNARNSYSYTTVVSPADGVVGTLPFRTGALVSPQLSQPLTTVSDNSVMYVYFSLSEKELQSMIRQYGNIEKMVAQMPEVRLQLSDGTMYDKTGRIESVSGVLNQATGSGQIRAAFDNESGILLTGGTGNIIIPHQFSDVICIPQSATYELQDKLFVYRVIDGKAQSTPITVHPLSDGKNYTVLSGLSEGDIIITTGVGMIKNGDTIATNIEEGKK